MSIENMKQMLIDAKSNKYAIPQFNINNLEWVKSILNVANETRSPVILGATRTAINHFGGFNSVVCLINGMVKDLNIKIPIVIHLDHGSNFEECKIAIDAGFTSVMIDASRYELNENIKITNTVKEYAVKNNVSVEAEIGTFDGNANEIKLAHVEDCVKIIKETNIDCLAASLGSTHGVGKEQNLDFDRLLTISKSTDVSLSLHGGSGITEEDLKQAIQLGCNKVNINTENMVIWSKKVREFLKLNSEEYHPRYIVNSGIEALEANLREKIMIFGSNGKG